MCIKVMVLFAVFLLIAGVNGQQHNFLDVLVKGTEQFSTLLGKNVELAKSATDLLGKKVDLINQLAKNAETFTGLFQNFYDEME